MTVSTFINHIEDAVPKLLKLAGDLTWNKLSGNCGYILTEIENTRGDFIGEKMARRKESDTIAPVPFRELETALTELYPDIYDVNLYIHRAKKKITIIDIRYYRRSSLEESYRQEVANNPPMIHCKVAIPPWVENSKEKFNINWERWELINTYRRLFYGMKLQMRKWRK